MIILHKIHKSMHFPFLSLPKCTLLKSSLSVVDTGFFWGALKRNYWLVVLFLPPYQLVVYAHGLCLTVSFLTGLSYPSRLWSAYTQWYFFSAHPCLSRLSNKCTNRLQHHSSLIHLSSWFFKIVPVVYEDLWSLLNKGFYVPYLNSSILFPSPIIIMFIKDPIHLRPQISLLSWNSIHLSELTTSKKLSPIYPNTDHFDPLPPQATWYFVGSYTTAQISTRNQYAFVMSIPPKSLT